MVVFITLQEQHCALDIKAQILDVYITSNKKSGRHTMHMQYFVFTR